MFFNLYPIQKKKKNPLDITPEMPGGASGVICDSSEVAVEGAPSIDEDPATYTAQLGALFGEKLREGVESTLFFRAVLVELGVFLSSFSARLSSFFTSLLSSR